MQFENIIIFIALKEICVTMKIDKFGYLSLRKIAMRKQMKTSKCGVF